MNLSIISSTDRPNSWSLKLSNYISRLYAERNVKAKVVSLEDFPLADVVGGKYGKEITSIKKFRDKWYARIQTWDNGVRKEKLIPLKTENKVEARVRIAQIEKVEKDIIHFCKTENFTSDIFKKNYN